MNSDIVDMQNISDFDLIQEILSGNKKSFELLVAKYSKLVADTAYVHVPPEHVEDISQEAFVKAYTKLGNLDNKSAFPGWLKTITIRLCQEYWRKEAKRKKDLECDENNIILYRNNGGIAEGDEQGNVELRMTLDKAMEVLNPKERILINLMYYDGHSIEETSQLMGVSSINVRVSGYRARKKLLQRLNELGIEEIRDGR